MLIILFGLAGAGKNFVGNILAEHFGYTFWDADDVLTDEMVDCIANKKMFTQPMRDRFVQIIINEITLRLQKHPNLVVSQALYREDNRATLYQSFPDALYIHVSADFPVISKRIHTRNNNIDEAYANQMNQFFEMPSFPHKVLINNKDKKAVIKQLNNIL